MICSIPCLRRAAKAVARPLFDPLRRRFVLCAGVSYGNRTSMTVGRCSAFLSDLLFRLGYLEITGCIDKISNCTCSLPEDECNKRDQLCRLSEYLASLFLRQLPEGLLTSCREFTVEGERELG